MLLVVEPSGRDPIAPSDPEDRGIRWTSRLLSASFALLVLAVAVGLLFAPDPLRWLTGALLAVVACAAIAHARALRSREGRRRAESESVNRLLRGLARSISPDAIVGAIAGELAPMADADHVVVVRRRDDPARLEATLVSNRPGVPSSTTLLPLSDLDDVGEVGRPVTALRPVSVVPEVIPAGASPSLVAPTGRPSRQEAGRDGRDAGWASPSRPAIDDDRPGATGSAPRSLGRRTVDVVSIAPAPDRSTLPAPGRVRGAGSGARRDAERAERIALRIADRVGSVYALRNTLAAPLIVDGAVSGALVLSRRIDAPWPASSRRRLVEAAAEASVALGRARSHQAAEARATTDALTGLPNRRYFDEFCGLLARRRRSGDAVGVLMIDIDRFKQLNDRHGHAAGDEVLRTVGSAIAAAVRDDDVPARYGGEEFVVLLRNPSGDIAAEIGERVRRAIADLDLRALGVPRVTVSVGVAVQRGADEPIAELVDRADRALYRAKRSGRDRVVAA